MTGGTMLDLPSAELAGWIDLLARSSSSSTSLAPRSRAYPRIHKARRWWEPAEASVVTASSRSRRNCSAAAARSARPAARCWNVPVTIDPRSVPTTARTVAIIICFLVGRLATAGCRGGCVPGAPPVGREAAT